MIEKKYSYRAEKDFYNKNWQEYKNNYLSLEPYLSCWLDSESSFSNKTILDIGAGKCAYTRLIADRFDPKMIVACELIPNRMLPAFKENINHKIFFTSGDCFKLPFKNSAFEVVFGSLVLHHLPELEKCIDEINRVLSKDGEYIGLEPNPFNPIQIYQHLTSEVSPNKFLLYPWYFNIFKSYGFKVKIRYFYPKLSWIRIPFWGSLMGVIAKKNI
jgi:ubiquinone/menaquinone biosynthesis C-methylase UbiE